MYMRLRRNRTRQTAAVVQNQLTLIHMPGLTLISLLNGHAPNNKRILFVAARAKTQISEARDSRDTAARRATH